MRALLVANRGDDDAGYVGERLEQRGFALEVFHRDAEGSVDIATDTDLKLWDYAAVGLIVFEAGGRCSTFGGASPSAPSSFVSTNGLLHEEAVALLSRGQTP